MNRVEIMGKNLKPAKLAELLRRFRKDDAGATAIIFALVIPIVLGFAALAVELGSAYSQKRVLQGAVDSASMSGAWAVLRVADKDAAAKTVVQADGLTVASAASKTTVKLTVNNPPKSGAYTGDAHAVEAILTQMQAMGLSSVISGQQTASITVRSVSTLTEIEGACILALEKLNAGAVDIIGTTTINLKKCGIFSNSTNAKSIIIGGNAKVTTDYLKTPGDVSVAGKPTVNDGGTLIDGTTSQSLFDSPRVLDPFASSPVPTTSGSSFGSVQLNGKVTGVNATLSPGTYTNLKINSNDKSDSITLSPGVYVIDGGTLDLSAQTKVIAKNVTFVLKNNATVTVNGQAGVELTAPATGSQGAPFIFYQDQPYTDSANLVNMKFNGGSAMLLNGAMYFPQGNLTFNGDGTAPAPACNRVVGRDINYTGSYNFQADCTGDTSSANKIVTTPELVE